MSLIDNEPRAATVIAAEPSVLLKLDGASFLQAINDHPEVARDIMRLMSRRLRFTNVYIQQIIDLSTKIAEGEYFDAMDQIRSSQSSVTGESSADQARIDALLSAFNELIEGVREREETLKSQVRQLTIQIDQQKREEEFKTITDTDFFADLKETARKLREEADEDDY
jgi:CRP-like cAMP-binding protein